MMCSCEDDDYGLEGIVMAVGMALGSCGDGISGNWVGTNGSGMKCVGND